MEVRCPVHDKIFDASRAANPSPSHQDGKYGPTPKPPIHLQECPDCLADAEKKSQAAAAGSGSVDDAAARAESAARIAQAHAQAAQSSAASASSSANTAAQHAANARAAAEAAKPSAT